MARTIDKRIMLDLIIEAEKTDPEKGPFSEWLAEYLVDHLPTLTPPNEPLTIEQPARINRESWTAEWEWFDEDIGNPLDGIERDWDWGWRCSKCGNILPDNFDNPDSPPKTGYCSACGRAMTPEAWDELAKRIGGMK